MKGQIIMRSFLSIGAITFVGAAALFSCGDDSSDPNPTNGGSGGAAGSAGGTAQGGTAGTGGGSGTGGTSGGGGTGGGGSTAACTGCVELTVPFTAAGQRATFQINYPAPGVDLSNATVTWRVQTTTPNAGLYVKPQAQNGMALGYAGYYDPPAQALSAAAFPAGQWVDVTFDFADVPAVPAGDAGTDGGIDAGDAGAPPAAGFDKSRVEAVQLQVGSTAAGTGTATVLVDSLTITNAPGVASPTFNAGAEGFALNMFSEPELIPAGSTAVAR